MGFAVEEDPIRVFEDLFACIDDARLDVGWRIEDFTSELSGGRDDYESNC